MQPHFYCHWFVWIYIWKYMKFYIFSLSLISSLISWYSYIPWRGIYLSLNVFMLFSLFFVIYVCVCLFLFCTPTLEWQVNNNILVKKNTWYNLDCLKFTKAWFVVKFVLYPKTFHLPLRRNCILLVLDEIYLNIN